MTVYEVGDEVIVVDAGLAFPRDEHLGVDLLLPDIGYLAGPAACAPSCSRTGTRTTSAACRTSCARSTSTQVIATPLTLALVKSKLDEHGLGAKSRAASRPSPATSRSSSARSASSSSAWRTRFPTPPRSSIETPAGRVVHTGDWKLDHTPVDGLKTDVGTLAEIGNRGVDLLLGDSTNAERPGNDGLRAPRR